MRNLSTLLSAVALASTAALAQSVQLPPAASISGYGTSGNYWRTTVFRFQMVYDSTLFTNQGVLQPISINSVTFQVGGATAASVAVTYPALNCYVQPAATDYAAASLTYATNRTVAFPTTPNFSGSVTTTGGLTTQGAQFLTIPLTTPLSYDPTLGVDLLIEIENTAVPTPLTGNTAWTTYNGTGAPPAGNLCTVARSTTSITATSGSFSAFVPIVNIGYSPAPNAGVATPIGHGCQDKFVSIYELFNPTATFDLQNSALTFLPVATTYAVVRTGAWITPGTIQPTPTVLTLADDADVNYPFTTGSFPGWTGLQVCSNGYVAQAAGNTLTAAPSAITCMNNNPQTAWYSQRDLDPSTATGGGTIQVEESATVTTVTYLGVPNWTNLTNPTPVTQPCDIQFQFYATGDVTIAWGPNMSTNQDNGGILVGYSPGGANNVPGSTDISAIGAGTVLLEMADTFAMTLSSVNRPVLNTTWNLQVGNIPNPSPVQIGVEIYGFSDPGINDLFFIGAAGCPLRANLDILNPWVHFAPATTHAYSLAVPNAPSLVGVSFYLQSAMMDPSYNGFGAITSNGVQGLIGSI